jgi:hypothetical protein
MSKIIAAALLSAFALAFISAPVKFDIGSGKIEAASAFAKQTHDGLDDGPDAPDTDEDVGDRQRGRR